MAAKKTLYEILGIPPDANDLDIGLAFQRRSLELQRGGNADPSELALITQARDLLSNAKRRAAYDATLVTASEKAAAAGQAQAPDLVVEADPGEEEGSKKLIPIVGVGVAIALGIFLWAKSGHPPEAPKVEAEAPAPKPPPPPPPKVLKEDDILAGALHAVGRIQSFDMGGHANPVGLALAAEPSAMITACHGIPAGAQLVAAVGKEQLSATLTITDEVLDLCKLDIAGLVTQPLPIAADDARPEDNIYALSANAKGEFILAQGTVKQVRATPAGPMLEVSMPISAAAGGGAIFDKYGKLVAVGIGGSGPGLAVPASAIAKMRTRPKDAK
jgi:hypothetical protein